MRLNDVVRARRFGKRAREAAHRGHRSARDRNASELAHMDFEFLYDRTRHLFAVGYNVDERQRDPSYYDLLASEARFSSFVAIAQGQVPQESWFALGRLLASSGERPDPAVVERLDVRVPDAAARDADLREHAAR